MDICGHFYETVTVSEASHQGSKYEAEEGQWCKETMKKTHTLALSWISMSSSEDGFVVDCSCCSWQTLMLVFSCICLS